jgi:hypothetical protein
MIESGLRRWTSTIVRNRGSKLTIGSGLAALLSALGATEGVARRHKRNGNDKNHRGEDDRDNDNVRGQGGRDARGKKVHEGDRDRDRHRDRDRDDHHAKSDRGEHGGDEDRTPEADASGGDNSQTHVFAIGDPVPGQNGFLQADGSIDWFS